MKHQCHAKGCTKVIPPKLLMCREHWRQVSPNLQKQIYKNYRQGQEIDKQPSQAYLEAMKQAIESVRGEES